MYHVFNDKTGNPAHDNTARKLNIMLNKRAHRNLRVTARSRRRRAQIWNIESKRYMRLVAAASFAAMAFDE